MEDKQQAILKDMEETRSSLTEKLEALESQVADKVQPVAEAVERVSEAAANIVEDVKETVHEVTDKVEETVKAVASAFDLREQFARKPWLAFGVAASTGCILGTLLGGRSSSTQAASAPAPRQKHGKGGGNGWHRAASHASAEHEAESQTHPGLFTEELQKLKGLAISSLMSVVRELAKRGLPEPIGCRVADEIDGLTSRLGGEPIQGEVLGNAFAGQEEQEQKPERKRSSTPGTGKKPDVGFNRLHASGGEIEQH